MNKILTPVESGHAPPLFPVGAIVSFYDGHSNRFHTRGRIVGVETLEFPKITKYRYNITRFGGMFKHNVRQTNIVYIDFTELLNL